MLLKYKKYYTQTNKKLDVECQVPTYVIIMDMFYNSCVLK